MKYCFDIDGTICTNTNGNYESAKPIENRINLINDLYEKENEIILFTARGSTTNIDWKEFGQNFIENELNLNYSFPTTQIEHYDSFAALCDNCRRINNILLDMCIDIWTYISHDYFKQKIIKGEVGSSAMPHKVNPIDFENSEGNLGLANSIDRKSVV